MVVVVVVAVVPSHRVLGLSHSTIISLSTEVLRVLALPATPTKNLMLLIIVQDMKHSHNNNT